MGRSSRDKSSSENLKGIIRKLEAENRQLRKQLARSNKEVQRAVDTVTTFLDDQQEFEIRPEKEEPVLKCIKCGHKVKTLELGPKILYSCTNSNCLHRRTVKK